MTDKTVSVPQPFPQTELKLLISKCAHCGEPLWDNGTVAVHLKMIIYEGKPTVLQTQWCDTTKKTIGETALISVPTESRPTMFQPLQNMTYEKHKQIIEQLVQEGLHDGKAWNPEAFPRYNELEQMPTIKLSHGAPPGIGPGPMCVAELAASSSLLPVPEPIPIDGKFGLKDGKIVNLVSGQEIPEDEPRTEQLDSWRELPIGHWFFHHAPNCVNRYSVQERTSGGCTLICSSPWHHESARRDMQEIAEAHNAKLASLPVGESTHQDCHDVVCSSSRRFPRGHKGDSCSCSYRAELGLGESREPLPKTEVGTQEKP